jgi:hypothetical protein
VSACRQSDESGKDEGNTHGAASFILWGLVAYSAGMTIEEAIYALLGEDLGAAIIDAQGVRWAILIARAASDPDKDRDALAAIDAWLDQQHLVLFDSARGRPKS